MSEGELGHPSGPPATKIEDPHGNQHAIDLLLRRPEELFERLAGVRRGETLLQLAALAIAGHLVYGVVVGSFSGGVQWWAAPLKILLGATLCGAICFPSLYIFASLSGADARPVQVLGLLLGVLSLAGILLAGFAPVAWVFSQSSTLVSFIGGLHVVVWAISMFATLRVLHAGLEHWHGTRLAWARLWLMVLIVTSLQMTTTLRPILGTSETLLDGQRKFFLAHWGDSFHDDATDRRRGSED